MPDNDGHMHEWIEVIESKDCRNCYGTGIVEDEGETIKCRVCKGTGTVKVKFIVCSYCGVEQGSFQGNYK
jgi:DnaJ-class molecular chaperone